MLIKIFRVLYGDYLADPIKANKKQYSQHRSGVMLINTTGPYMGRGSIKGVVRLEGAPSINTLVTAYHSGSGIKMWSSTTGRLGKFSITNLEKGAEFFIVAQDPDRIENAQVKDRIVAK